MGEQRTEYSIEVNVQGKFDREPIGRLVEDWDQMPNRQGAFERAEWLNRLFPKSEAVVVKRTVTYGDWEKA